MRARFTDAHRARGRGLGITRWVADWLPVRIDYLYASSELNWARTTRALDARGCSDHQPVMGWLTLPKGT